MNKFLAWILAIVFVFAMAGCGNSTEVENDGDAVVNSEKADTDKADTEKEDTEKKDADKAEADKTDADKAKEEQPLTPEEEKAAKEEIQKTYEETMKNTVLVKKSEFVKQHDDAVIADGLDKKNCLSEKAVTESGADSIPESVANVYPEAKKRYRYPIGVTSDGTEYLSLDVLTDADDNILYLSSQLLSSVWDNNEDVRNYYMANCGQILAGFTGSKFEEGYDNVVAAYNNATNVEENKYMYWNDYRYFMSNSGDGGYIGFVIQAPFVE